MKYIGMPMGMWLLFHRSFREAMSAFSDSASQLRRRPKSEAGGACKFVRQYTLASGGSYCDCGYKKLRR